MYFYTVGGIVILLLSALEGARGLNRRVDCDLSCVEGCIALVRYIRVQIDCYAMPLEEIFKRCDENILVQCGYTDDEMPGDLPHFFNRLRLSNKELCRIVFDFSVDFGKHYREEQLKRCDACIAELEALRDSVRQTVANRKKLNTTLCLSGVAALIILLI